MMEIETGWTVLLVCLWYVYSVYVGEWEQLRKFGADFKYAWVAKLKGEENIHAVLQVYLTHSNKADQVTHVLAYSCKASFKNKFKCWFSDSYERHMKTMYDLKLRK